MLTFDEWIDSEKRIPRNEWTLSQYGKYAEGWRNSLPWAYSGMSISYDKWAELKWHSIQDKNKLKEAWRLGLGLCANSILVNTKVRKKDADRFEEPTDTNWKNKSVEEAADFILNVFL